MNRGSNSTTGTGRPAALSFNEAPIHESGKWHLTGPSPDRTASRFNEAPIHESGKFAKVEALGGTDDELQ